MFDFMKERIVGISFIHFIVFMSTAYNAVGLTSFDLFDEIDFDSWFTSHLLQELQVKHKRYSPPVCLR